MVLIESIVEPKFTIPFGLKICYIIIANGIQLKASEKIAESDLVCKYTYELKLKRSAPIVSEADAAPMKKRKTGGSMSSKRSEAQTNAATPNLVPQVHEIKATDKDESRSSS